MVRYITYRQNHHSLHSGYDRLTQFSQPAINSKPFSTTIVRNRLLWRIASGVIAYDRTALATEVKSAWQMMRSHQTIYHILYGENTYHYLGLLNNFRKNRLVATFHLPPLYFQDVVNIEWHLKQLSAIICVGRSQVDFFSNIVGNEKVFYVPHGIDTDYFHPPASFEQRDPNLCLFVGNYLRDFPALRGVIELVTFQRPNTCFVAVTSKGNIEKIGYHPNLTFKSGITEEELLHLYQTASVLVIPMVDATANNAVLEGMASGIPVVITDVGDTRNYTGSEGCRLIPKNDTRKMAEAVIGLFEGGDQLRVMSNQARQQALKFTWSEIYSQLQLVYDYVL